jgi:hypothetical protein
VINGGKNEKGNTISAEEYFKTIIESTNIINKYYYCSVNGMPALIILSTYKNWYTTKDDLYESIDIWNKSYTYLLNFCSNTQSLAKFTSSDHYLIFQLMVSTFEENIL